MTQFSDDGQWWWDGQNWIATSQVVIPDLSISPPESVLRLMRVRQQLGEAGTIWSWVVFAAQAYPLDLLLWLPFLVIERRGLREFRQWTLDQLASATMYLLGPGEPMVAGEAGLYRPFTGFSVAPAIRDLAVVVTASHVLVLRFDRFDGQPRLVAVAARASDVEIVATGEFLRARSVIVVRHGRQWWTIKGMVRVMRREPVIAAWKAALLAR